MTDQPIAVKVVETPAERLRRVALVEYRPREDLWHAIAEAVIDINERLAVLEAEAADRATWTSTDNRLRWPQTGQQQPTQGETP